MTEAKGRVGNTKDCAAWSGDSAKIASLFMNLSTRYLGLELSSPLIVGASPFADEVNAARQLQDLGAGAIVMRSLFEEQLYLDRLEQAALIPAFPRKSFPALSDYQLSPKHYLTQIGDLKAALEIPVIASLNGSAPGSWIDYGSRCEAAGADAIELNLYQLSSDPNISALEIEAELLETAQALKESVNIPVAVKLQPYHTAVANFAHELERGGADGIVLFNRLYQSDYPADGSDPLGQVRLSDSSEIQLRLRWLALLAPKLKCSLAITGGVEGGEHAVKALLAGADTVQIVSALLRNGPRYLAIILEGLRQWMREWGFERLDEFQGRLSRPGPDAEAHERADYQRLLQSWRI